MLSHKNATAGYSYVEVLVAMVLIATSLSPMIESIANAVNHQRVQTTAQDSFIHAQDRLALVLAEPFEDLDTEATDTGSATTASDYSDPAGTTNRALVYLARFDTDNADADNNELTGGDAGLLWLRVAIEHTTYDLETLVVAP